MKKIIFYLIAIVFIAFTACEEQDNIDRYDLGTEFFVSNSGMTVLDESVTFSIDNISKNLSELSVSLVGEDKDTDLGKVTLSEGAGSIVINATDLGLSAIDDEATLNFTGSIDGKSIVRSSSVAVTDPISITSPEIYTKDSIFYFYYSVAPVSATVTSIKVETKKLASEDYQVVGGTFDVSIDSVGFKGTDYAIGDSIYIKITASTATKSTSSEVAIEVTEYNYFSITGSIVMNDNYNTKTQDSLAIDLLLGKSVVKAEAGDSADVVMSAYYDNVKGLVVEFNSEQNAVFVPVTDSLYTIADSSSIMSIDFSSGLNSYEAVKGATYAYQTYRGSNSPSVGLIKIANIDKPQGEVKDVTLEIEYKNPE